LAPCLRPVRRPRDERGDLIASLEIEKGAASGGECSPPTNIPAFAWSRVRPKGGRLTPPRWPRRKGSSSWRRLRMLTSAPHPAWPRLLCTPTLRHWERFKLGLSSQSGEEQKRAQQQLRGCFNERPLFQWLIFPFHPASDLKQHDPAPCAQGLDYRILSCF
jgi:hypothetical protein